MPDTRHFYTQPLQLVTASVNSVKCMFRYDKIIGVLRNVRNIALMY